MTLEEPTMDPVLTDVPDPLGSVPLRITVSWVDEQPIVSLVGELDVATAPLLRARLAAIADTHPHEVVLDLGCVTFLDSTGISLLVMEHKRLLAERGRLVLFSPTPMARRVLEISGLTDYLTIQPAEPPKSK